MIGQYFYSHYGYGRVVSQASGGHSFEVEILSPAPGQKLRDARPLRRLALAEEEMATVPADRVAIQRRNSARDASGRFAKPPVEPYAPREVEPTPYVPPVAPPPAPVVLSVPIIHPPDDIEPPRNNAPYAPAVPIDVGRAPITMPPVPGRGGPGGPPGAPPSTPPPASGGGGGNPGGSPPAGGGGTNRRPIIISVSPKRAEAGQAFVIYGRNLGETSRVTIGNTECAIYEVRPGSVVAEVCSDAQSGRVTVDTPNGSASSTQNLEIGEEQSQGFLGDMATRFATANLLNKGVFQNGIGRAAMGAATAGGAAAIDAGQSLVGGAASVIDTAFGVGAKLGHTLLAGILSPFGASGQAVSGLASGVLGAGQSAIGSGLRLGAGLLGTGAGFVNNAVSGTMQAGAGIMQTVGGVAGDVIGFGGKGLGAMTKGAGLALGIGAGVLGLGALVGSAVISAGADMVKGLLSAATDALKTTVKEVGELFGSLAGVIGAAGVALVAVLADISSETSKLYRNANAIQANTGISFGRAVGLDLAMAPLGIDAGKLMGNSAFSPMMMGARFGMAGINNDVQTDPYGFLHQGAKKYESVRDNPIALQMFRASVGEDRYQQLAPTWAMGSERLGNISKLNDKFGVDPGQVEKAGKDMAEISAIFGLVGQRIKVILMSSLVPFLETALPKALAWLTGHSDEIVKGIQAFGRSLLAVPGWAMHAAAGLAGAGSRWLQTGAKWIEGIGGQSQQFFKAFDFIANGIRGFIINVISSGAFLLQWGKNLISDFQNGVGLPGVISKIGAGANSLLPGVNPKDGISNAITGGLVAAGALSMAGRAAVRLGAGAASAETGGIGGAGAAGALLGGTYGYATGGGLLAGATAGMIGVMTAVGAAAGTGIGYMGYKGAQAVGLVDKNQGFGDRMKVGWGHLRDLVTRNPGNFERLEAAAATGNPQAAAALRQLQTEGVTKSSLTGGGLGDVTLQDGQDPGEYSANIRKTMESLIPVSNMSGPGATDWMKNMRTSVSGRMMDTSKWLGDQQTALDSGADKYESKVEKILGEINVNTKKAAENKEKAASQYQTAAELMMQSASIFQEMARREAADYGLGIVGSSPGGSPM